MKYTIIITVYNKEKYIKRCLDSVLNQNYDQYELLIINDGSTDNSDKIIKEYQKKYKFKYINKKNTGIADTRNLAIKKVKTKYFMFVDADDYIETNLLQTLDKYKEYEILSFNAIKKNKELEFIKNLEKPKFKGSGEEYFIKLVNKKAYFIVPWGYMYNTEYIIKNKFKYPTGKIMEDFFLTPFIIMSAKKVISIDYIGYYNIEVENSITSKNNQKLITQTYIEHYKKLVKEIEKYPYQNKTKEKYILFISKVLLWYGSTLDSKEQSQYLKIINRLNVIDKVNNKTIKKILVKLNIYYKIRNIIRRFI